MHAATTTKTTRYAARPAEPDGLPDPADYDDFSRPYRGEAQSGQRVIAYAVFATIGLIALPFVFAAIGKDPRTAAALAIGGTFLGMSRSRCARVRRVALLLACVLALLWLGRGEVR